MEASRRKSSITGYKHRTSQEFTGNSVHFSPTIADIKLLLYLTTRTWAPSFPFVLCFILSNWQWAEYLAGSTCQPPHLPCSLMMSVLDPGFLCTRPHRTVIGSDVFFLSLPLQLSSAYASRSQHLFHPNHPIITSLSILCIPVVRPAEASPSRSSSAFPHCVLLFKALDLNSLKPRPAFRSQASEYFTEPCRKRVPNVWSVDGWLLLWER